MPGLTVERATPADANAVEALLRAADLPSDDVEPHLSTFLVARADGEVVGAIGAEVGAGDALLRSAVVSAAHRGHGLGQSLVAALDRIGGEWGVTRWWLLTTTAEAFFARDGFVVSPRASAPAAIRETRQFSGGICSSAVCMTRERRGG